MNSLLVRSQRWSWSLLESLGWKGHGGLAWIANHCQMSFLRYTNQIHVCLWKMWTTYRPAFQIYKCDKTKMQTMWWPISSFEKPKKLDTYEPSGKSGLKRPWWPCLNQIHLCLWKMWTTYRPAFQIYKCEQAKMQTMWWTISSFEKPKKLDTYR